MERAWESLQAEDQHGQRPKVVENQSFENGRNAILRMWGAWCGRKCGEGEQELDRVCAALGPCNSLWQDTGSVPWRDSKGGKQEKKKKKEKMYFSYYPPFLGEYLLLRCFVSFPLSFLATETSLLHTFLIFRRL